MEYLKVQDNPTLREGDYLLSYSSEYNRVVIGICHNPMAMRHQLIYDFLIKRTVKGHGDGTYCVISFNNTIYRLDEAEYLEYVLTHQL